MARTGGARSPRAGSFLAALVVVAAGAAYLGSRRPAPSAERGQGCPESDPACAPGGDERPDPLAGPSVSATEVCRDAGYLCAELATAGEVTLRRWRDFEGTMLVHVPAPDFEDPGTARDLQRAAAAGIRAWNGQPFPVVADEQGRREPHFRVRWVRTLPGSQIGRAGVQWSTAAGLSVLSLELATRSPFDPDRALDPAQVRLTAAHEMGHALGLPHSDVERDVMYPTNTATTLTVRDYLTVEALYRLDDGLRIVR